MFPVARNLFLQVNVLRRRALPVVKMARIDQPAGRQRANEKTFCGVVGTKTRRCRRRMPVPERAVGAALAGVGRAEVGREV